MQQKNTWNLLLAFAGKEKEFLSVHQNSLQSLVMGMPTRHKTKEPSKRYDRKNGRHVETERRVEIVSM